MSGEAPGAHASHLVYPHLMWSLGSGVWSLGFGFWVLGLGFWVWVAGFGVWGLGVRVCLCLRLCICLSDCLSLPLSLSLSSDARVKRGPARAHSGALALFLTLT